MPISDAKNQPTQTKGEDLTICPICFGHTKLLGESVYCPNCALIISENLSDTMKTKVALIKEQVSQQQAATDYQNTKYNHAAKHVIVFFLALIVAGLCFVFGVTGYDIVRAYAFERGGDYAQAAIAYDQSRWLVTLPGIKQAITRSQKLDYSSQQYALGQTAFGQKNWQQSIHYFNLVDPADRNYNRAQFSKKIAQYNADQH